MRPVCVSPEVYGYAAKVLVETYRRDGECTPDAHCSHCEELHRVTGNADLLFRTLFLLSVRLLETVTAAGLLTDDDTVLGFAREPDTEPDEVEEAVEDFVQAIRTHDFEMSRAIFRDVWNVGSTETGYFAHVLIRTVACVPIEL